MEGREGVEETRGKGRGENGNEGVTAKPAPYMYPGPITLVPEVDGQMPNATELSSRPWNVSAGND